MVYRYRDLKMAEKHWFRQWKQHKYYVTFSRLLCERDVPENPDTRMHNNILQELTINVKIITNSLPRQYLGNQTERQLNKKKHLKLA